MFTFFCLCDAHIHLARIEGMEIPKGKYFAATCAQSEEELRAQSEAMSRAENSCEAKFAPLLGLHPREPDERVVDALENLLGKKKIIGIGEAGLDFSTKALKDRRDWQLETFDAQIGLCARFGVPLVAHCVRAMREFFERSKSLARAPAVVFHSFPGSAGDALAFLRRGVNAYFSFGERLLSLSENAALCAARVPIERLLLETDAPREPLVALPRAYEAAMRLRGMEGREEFAARIMENFFSAYGL